MHEDPAVRVMALHALIYCERLFYLEEVEEIRVADERVWAGRREHLELDETGELVQLTLESEQLGLRGRLDALRCRDGRVYPVEHKRGRSRLVGKTHEAWDSDRVQLGAYALRWTPSFGPKSGSAKVEPAGLGPAGRTRSDVLSAIRVSEYKNRHRRSSAVQTGCLGRALGTAPRFPQALALAIRRPL
jgi:hypothetical protein